MKSYQEAKELINTIIQRNEREAEQLIYYWSAAFRKSEMFLLDGLCRRIDTCKAEKHLLVVNLYDLVLSYGYPFYRKNAD